MNPIKIAPSLLAADFARLKDEIQRVEAGGADLLHLDVMDGHFVPNLTVGPSVVESIRKVTRLPLECHLMVMEPEKYAPAFVSAGADTIIFHAEAVAFDHARKYKERGWAIQLICSDFFDRARLDAIRDAVRGKRLGVAINPDTDAEVLDSTFPVDLVLAMTVWPGFGGQAFIDAVVPKIAKIRKALPDGDIEVDGGLNGETVARAAEAGANVIVAGSAVFKAPDASAAIRTLREKARRAHGV